MPAPYSFWPRDQVSSAGPLNQSRISVSLRPNCENTRYLSPGPSAPRSVDAREREPVDEGDPLVLAVPHERVRVRAHVERVRPRHDSAARECRSWPRGRGHFDAAATAARPAYGEVRDLTQVRAEARGELVRAARCDGNVTRAGGDDRVAWRGEVVAASIDERQCEIRGLPSLRSRRRVHGIDRPRWKDRRLPRARQREEAEEAGRGEACDHVGLEGPRQADRGVGAGPRYAQRTERPTDPAQMLNQFRGLACESESCFDFGWRLLLLV